MNWLTVKDVSNRLGIKTDSVLAHIRAGRLVALNVSNGLSAARYRISEAEFDAFVQRQSTGRTVEPEPRRRAKRWVRPANLKHYA